MTENRFERSRFDAELTARALKDPNFRRRLMENPTAVYGEALRDAMPGRDIPEGVEIRIAEETENVFYVVLPCIPATMHLSDETLDRVARHEQTHRNPCWGLGDAPE